MKRRFVIACAACAVLVACGGAPRPAEAPASPASNVPASKANGAAPSEAPAAGYAQPSQAESAPQTMSVAPPPPAASPPARSEAASDRADRDEESRRETADRAARDLEAAARTIATSDCPTACRALGSMERAIAFLCMSIQSDADGDRCASAKGRLVSSRKHVAAACGSCPGGPSVDPDAPVPSKK